MTSAQRAAIFGEERLAPRCLWLVKWRGAKQLPYGALTAFQFGVVESV